MRWQSMPEGKEKYAAYLCSREWSVLKEKVRHRSAGVCERCHMHPMDHVHHLTYKRKYNERLDDLQACCKPCHEFIHAKSDQDPAIDRPAVIPWCGRSVKTFYLAGKITGTDWRQQIVSDWSYENHSNSYFQAYFDYASWEQWGVVPNVCTVMDGVRLHYSGPWWRDSYCHGFSDESGFPHGYTAEAHAEIAPLQAEIANAAASGIAKADMLFAWVDSSDCFGTLVEIGYAKGLRKVVVVAFSSRLNCRELWFARAAANYAFTADTPLDAWSEFWNLAHFEHSHPEHATDGAAQG